MKAVSTYSSIPLDWPKWHGLATRAVQTNGIVTAKEPSNHMSIRYSYIVGQQTYAGVGHVGGATPKFEQLKEGDSIVVFYDSANPEVSSPSTANRQSTSIIMAVLFAIIVAPVLDFSVCTERDGFRYPNAAAK